MISILTKIIKLNHLNVIGIVKKDNTEIFNVLTIKRVGEKIDVLAMLTFYTWNELIKDINPKLPILLVIDGKGTLQKEINMNNELDVNWYNNIDFKSIYHTSLKSSNSSFMSFCRKNIVDDILTKFQKKGFNVIDIYIGPFLAALLKNSIKSETIISSELQLVFENETLVDFTKYPGQIGIEKYKIGGQYISSSVLPLYGVLVHFFLQQKEVSKTKNSNINIEESIYKKTFNIFGIAILICFLVSLLTSYILIRHYSAKNAELSLKNIYSNQSYRLLLDLEKQKEKKQNILRKSGFLSSKFLSFYSYEIIRGIPNDINLNEININPLSNEIKTNQKMNLEINTILVKGDTFEESSFNNWIGQLKKMLWIKNFEIINLKKDKKNKSQFEVKITIKDV